MDRQGIMKTVYAYTTAISTWRKCGDWKKALTLWEDMCKEGIVPNAITYNALISDLGKGSQRKKKAIDVHKMQKGGHRSKSDYVQCNHQRL